VSAWPADEGQLLVRVHRELKTDNVGVFNIPLARSVSRNSYEVPHRHLLLLAHCGPFIWTEWRIESWSASLDSLSALPTREPHH
jgi:hypothetical protein